MVWKDLSPSDKLAVIAIVVAIVVAVFGVLASGVAVPEIRKLIGFDSRETNISDSQTAKHNQQNTRENPTNTAITTNTTNAEIDNGNVANNQDAPSNRVTPTPPNTNFQTPIPVTSPTPDPEVVKNEREREIARNYLTNNARNIVEAQIFKRFYADCEGNYYYKEVPRETEYKLYEFQKSDWEINQPVFMVGNKNYALITLKFKNRTIYTWRYVSRRGESIEEYKGKSQGYLKPINIIFERKGSRWELIPATFGNKSSVPTCEEVLKKTSKVQ